MGLDDLLLERQREETSPGTHLAVVGASGVRFACRVCRVAGLNADLTKNPAWLEPCAPSNEALLKFERAAIERVEAGLADLRHAAALRARHALSANQSEQGRA